MCESVGNADFDVEAQESLLAEEERISSSSVDAKQKLWRYILFIHSTLVFKSQAHHYASSSSSTYDDDHKVYICFIFNIYNTTPLKYVLEKVVLSD